MSIETWKKEFQLVSPEDAARAGTREALEAEYLAWQGTTRKAMRKHGVEYWCVTAIVAGQDGQVALRGADGPLCRRYNPEISTMPDRCHDDCPIFVVTGDYCTRVLGQCSDIDTGPMRQLMEEVLREWERKHGGKQ